MYRPVWWDNIKMCIRNIDVSLCLVFSAGSVAAVVNNKKLSNSLEYTYSVGADSRLAVQVFTLF